MKKNAYEYHQKLSELEKLIDSIKYSMEYVDAAFTHLTEEHSDIISMALSLAQGDLRKSLEKFQHSHDTIVQKLSNIYP
jgi:archaellum component FlaC